MSNLLCVKPAAHVNVRIKHCYSFVHIIYVCGSKYSFVQYLLYGTCVQMMFNDVNSVSFDAAGSHVL